MLLDRGGAEIARIEAALGSPDRPLDEAALAAKAGPMAGALEDPNRPLEVLALAGLPLTG